MIHTPVIPDRQIVRILPSMSNLKIMIVNNQSQKPIKKPLALAFCQPVDVLHVVAQREDRLPPCDGICTDYWVHGNQLFADIFGRPACFGVDFESIFGRGFIEFRLRVGGGQPLEKLLDGG